TLPSVSGVLDGVTLGTDFNLTGTLLIRNGVTLGNATTLNLNNNTLAFQTTGTQHLGLAAGATAATVSMAGGTIQAGNNVSGQTLNIDSGVTVQGYGNFSQSSLATIVNAGTILTNTVGQSYTISPGTFTNSGTMNVSAGTLTISPTTFTNGGALTDSGGTLSINATNRTNPRTINVQAGTVNLGGAFTLANLGTFTRTAGSVVNLTGTLTNAGTLNIGTGAPFGPGGLNSFSGVIVGGTLSNNDASHTLPSVSGVLDGVTLGTDFNLTGTLLIRNGATLGDATTLNLNNNTLACRATGTQHIATPGTATISMAGGTIQAGNNVSGQTLNIDSGVTVQGYGNFSQSSLATIVNAGTILTNTVGQSSTISPGTFTNSGTMNVSAGTLTISPTTFTNGGALTDSGGTLSINATNRTNPRTINVQAGTVNLGGAFTLANLGTFTRTAGSVVNLTGTLTNAGTLNIGTGAPFGPGGLNSFSGVIVGGTLSNNDA